MARSRIRRWMLALFAAVLLLAGRTQAQDPGEDEPTKGAEAEEPDAEEGEEGEDAGAKDYPKPERVTVGVYLNDIQAIDLKTHSYAVDLYIWFRWKNPDVDPTASLEFVNPFELWGHMQTNNYEEAEELENGELYQAIRVQGGFSKKLPLYNYPFDRQTLTVAFEDAVNDVENFVYVPDTNPVTVNPKLVLPGYVWGNPTLTIEGNTYPTQFGYPNSATYSRVTVDLPVHRPPMAYAAKLLVPVLCVIVCAALMFLLSPSFVDSRVDVGITSLLTIVALQMTFNQDVPDVGYLMLMDKLYLCAYLFVIAGLAIVVRSTRMVEEKREAEAVALHRTSLIGLVSLWGLANVVLVWSAYSAG